MGDEFGGLDRFADELNPAVIDEVVRWEHDPELGRILARLRSHNSRKAFLDTYAEAVVARRLLARGCHLKFEVATPQGRHCDFEVDRSGDKFFLHVKRIDTDRPARNPRQLLAISSRLRALERIARPYIVQVRWRDELKGDQMRRLVEQAGEFILRARVGDEMSARDDAGRELGGVRVIAPWDGSHVNVTIGLPEKFVDQAPRFRRLMHRAYHQFMPRAVNVIAICSAHADDAADFETALLGSHIERWDAFPPRGKRVAHGRAADGFWHGQRFPESRFAAWLGFSPADHEPRSRLWVRRDLKIDAAMEELLRRVFESTNC